MDWATKRKIQYFSIIVGLVLVFFVIPFYFFIYEPPTCFDGTKNGKETGVDCGGDCRLLCPAEAIDPILRWDPRIFKISEGVYSVLAYIENPNISAEVRRAPYTFKIYDRDGIVITERKGDTFIPKGKTFAVFDGNFSLGERIPFRVTFDFGPLVWTRDTEPDPDISITNKALMNEETEPRVEASIENKTQERLLNIELIAIIFDATGNAVASSRTFVEQLDRGQISDVFFTWPLPFETRDKVCQAPVDVSLILDRSGSMSFLGENPPQPLTDVKNSAIEFAKQLSENDQLSMVSFATTASEPIDFNLSGNISEAIQSIESMQIFSNGIQHTNIGDGILKAGNELNSSRHRNGSEKVMILLTDGVATHPQMQGDSSHPESYALSVAEQMKNSGIYVFSIGLGKDINLEFLSNIASTPQDSYLAPTARDLVGIYSQIATKICQERPIIIDIIPRIYPR